MENYRGFFRPSNGRWKKTLNGIDSGLNWLPPVMVIIVIGLAAWRYSGYKLANFLCDPR